MLVNHMRHISTKKMVVYILVLICLLSIGIGIHMGIHTKVLHFAVALLILMPQYIAAMISLIFQLD